MRQWIESQYITSGSYPVSVGTIGDALPPPTTPSWYFPLVNSSNNTVYNAELVDQMYVPCSTSTATIGLAGKIQPPQVASRNVVISNSLMPYWWVAK